MHNLATGINHEDIAEKWLLEFSTALTAADATRAAAAFLPTGYLRDVLTFEWDNRTLHTPQKIADYLRKNLDATKPESFTLETRPGLAPEYGHITPTASGVSSGFTYKTSIAHGQGFFRLKQDDNGEWKALTVFMAIVDLKGYEESGKESGRYEGHTQAWIDVLHERRKQNEENPYVVIVGAGQTGLNLAARFKQMNIATLVIESNNRIGDTWRNRYPTLTLHTTRIHHTMLYQPYPKNWPLYTPRDKLADWLEQYAISQDLVVWTKSRVLPLPKYDVSSKKWTVNVNKCGVDVVLHPAHLVVATGTIGSPYIPEFTDSALFKGTVLHSSVYKGGKEFAGQRVVVIGAGNTGADICQDITTQGAQSTTMVQRSTTCIVASSSNERSINHIWPEDQQIEISDFKCASMPISMIKRIAPEIPKQAWAVEHDMHEKLGKVGFKANLGKYGSGIFPMLFDRLGGYWIDVGCAELIIGGRIAVKQGTEIERFKEDGIVFSDGSSLVADAIIYATGYIGMQDSLKEFLGEETMTKIGSLWGLDDEDELRGGYRPTGHLGLWFGNGDFHNARFSSKQLAITLKAIEVGLYQEPERIVSQRQNGNGCVKPV